MDYDEWGTGNKLTQAKGIDMIKERAGRNGRRRFTSISVQTIIMQTVMVGIPLIVCIWLFLYSNAFAFFSNTAQISYEYSRNMMNSFEASLLSMKSACNVIVHNAAVMDAFSAEEKAEEDGAAARISAFVMANAGSRNIVERASLYAVDNSGEFAKSVWPFWTGDKGKYGWQFDSDRQTVSWLQEITRDNQTIGILEIIIRMKQLQEMTDNISRVSNGTCYLLLPSGEVFMTSENRNERETLSLSEYSFAEGSHMLGRHGFQIVLFCGAMNVYYVSVEVPDVVTSLGGSGMPSFFILLCLVIALTIVVVIYYNRIFTKRIKALSEEIATRARSLEDGHAVTRFSPIEERGRDEIDELAANFNLVSEKLIESTAREKNLQMLQQTAKFSALQAQIQPHFLYNTLETLRMKAYENNDDEVAEMLFTLGKLMRNSISGRETETTLQRELDNIVNYLKLNKLRFERLEYSIVCDEDVSNLVCPRFILQPLVENSIHHGVSRVAKRDIYIRIHIYRESPFIYVVVEDNGVGIPPERLQAIRESLMEGVALEQLQGGIGVYNVHSRLKMYYGNDSGLEIESEESRGTRCIIRIHADTKGAV